MCFGVNSRYGTPLGLIIITPARRSTADTLPKVPITRPVSARRRLARKATSRSDNDSLLLEREQPLHERARVGPGAGHAAERVVELPIQGIQLIVHDLRVGIGLEPLRVDRRHAVLRVGPRIVAARA